MKIKDLQITNLKFSSPNDIHNGSVTISWSANVGFGEYTLFVDKKGNIRGDTEFMDSNNDKKFTQLLFNELINKLNIVC